MAPILDGEGALVPSSEKRGLISVIRYEGDNETLVWKYPIEDFNMGSQLIDDYGLAMPE